LYIYFLSYLHVMWCDAFCRDGALVSQEGGMTLLHLACSSSAPGSVEIVRLLLDALADPNAQAAPDDSYLNHFLVSFYTQYRTLMFLFASSTEVFLCPQGLLLYTGFCFSRVWANRVPHASNLSLSLFVFFSVLVFFYARKQLLLSVRLSHRNSVCPSVRPSVPRVNQSKTV